MCGINITIVSPSVDKDTLFDINNNFYTYLNRISHRGPDHTCIQQFLNSTVTVGFVRLAIQGISATGNQPFVTNIDDRIIVVVCNGEIYNHREIEEKYDITPVSKSDCEVILHMYTKFGISGVDTMCKMFNSEHAFVILDMNTTTKNTSIIMSSDRFGIRPLFYGSDKNSFQLGIPPIIIDLWR